MSAKKLNSESYHWYTKTRALQSRFVHGSIVCYFYLIFASLTGAPFCKSFPKLMGKQIWNKKIYNYLPNVCS